MNFLKTCIIVLRINLLISDINGITMEQPLSKIRVYNVFISLLKHYYEGSKTVLETTRVPVTACPPIYKSLYIS